jgi:hypothetical protein
MSETREEEPSVYLMRDVIRGHQRQSEPSVYLMREVIRAHQEAIKSPSRVHQESIKRPSRGHQEAIKRRRLQCTDWHPLKAARAPRVFDR